MEQLISSLLANPVTLGLVMVVGFVLLLLGAASNKARRLQRWHGAVLLIVYAAYLAYRLI